MVHVLTESFQVQSSIRHVHQDLLLCVVDEVMRSGCLTFEQVGMSEWIDLGAELTRAE